MLPCLSAPIPEVCVQLSGGRRQVVETLYCVTVSVAGSNSVMLPRKPSVNQICPLGAAVIRCGRESKVASIGNSWIEIVPLAVGVKVPMRATPCPFSVNQIFPLGSLV